MNVFIPINTENGRQNCYNENPYLRRNSSSTQRTYQLTAHNSVDTGPTNARGNIEQCHHLRTDPAERKPRDSHLTQPKFGPECRQEGNREYAKHIKDNDGSNRSEEHTSELQSHSDL